MRPIKKVINLPALLHNWQTLEKKSGNAQMIAVVKANAYGHDIATIAPILAVVAPMFAVACIEEAMQLRSLGIKTPVMLLEGVFTAEELALCQRHQFLPVIHSYRQLEWLRDNPQFNLSAWLKIDSGMHRLGFMIDEFESVKIIAKQLKHIDWKGVITHFSCADNDDLIHTNLQIARSTRLALPTNWQRCFANSAATLRLPETHFDWVRLGIMLYGLSPLNCEDGVDLGLRPVMTLQTEILVSRTLDTGESAGYDQGFIAPQAGQLATIAIGYGDGFPWNIPSGKVPVRIAGKIYYLVGRIAMDMALVWLGDDKYPDGTIVTIFGDNLPAEEVARAAKTIPYTLTTMLTSRVYVEVVNG